MNKDVVVVIACLVFAFGIFALALGYRIFGEVVDQKRNIDFQVDQPSIHAPLPRPKA